MRLYSFYIIMLCIVVLAKGIPSALPWRSIKYSLTEVLVLLGVVSKLVDALYMPREK